jgi:uncharacterized membrane protein HdeD (DUF308 family)
MTDVEQQFTVNPVLGDLKQNWGWILALGLLFMLLGFIGLGMTFGLTMVSVLFLGVLLVIGGVLQFLDTLKCHQWKGALWHVLIALLYIVGGGLVIYDPIMASAVITAMLAGILIAIGISRFIMALMVRGAKGWVWLLIGGIASFILGMMILLHWPVSGLWFIGLFIAIEMIVHGWTYVLVALAARSA